MHGDGRTGAGRRPSGCRGASSYWTRRAFERNFPLRQARHGSERSFGKNALPQDIVDSASDLPY
jgi:hypothetical protein